MILSKYRMKNLSEKILYLLTILLILATVFLSLAFLPKKGVLVFLFLFLLVYWQRKRLQNFFQKIKNPKTGWIVYLLTGWLGAILLEFSLGISPFHPRPIANYLVGMGFYLPYFAIWLMFIKRYQYDFWEIFYLGGFGKIIFDLVITRKLLIAASVATNALSSLLIFTSQAIVTLVLFGIITTMPTLYLEVQENRKHNKPVKQYLVGLTPNFFAGGLFIIWTIILKIIFRS